MDGDRPMEEVRKMADACDKSGAYSGTGGQAISGDINQCSNSPHAIYRLERAVAKMGAQAETAQAVASQAFYLTEFYNCLPRVLTANQQRGLEILLSRAGF